jgi:cation diffusion facilitator CzcD-associated flavoprotein CzcO
LEQAGHQLFNKHCEALIEGHGLAALRLRARAQGLRPIPGGWQVETSKGALDARRVVLALGLGEQPAWPAWARSLQAAGGQVGHVFDEAQPPEPPSGGRAVVVGGGISAAQWALQWVARGGLASLIMRHPWRVYMFDADPGWIGPKLLRGFWAERSPAKRRAMIQEARLRGSLPPDTKRAVERAIAEGRLEVRRGEVAGAQATARGVEVALSDGALLTADAVVLATGFERTRPGGAWLDAAIEAHNLPCAPCGYPLVDDALRWRPGLWAVGALGELTLGPVARNIIGARAAAQRVAATAMG